MRFQRLAVVFACAMIIAAIPVSNYVMAGNDDKTTICHFPDSKTVGNIISVSNAALDTHIKMHGDLTSFSPRKGSNDCVGECKIQFCSKGEVFDPKLCRCVPGKCEEQLCKLGTVWDPKQCKCVPDGKCEPQKCPIGTTWDSKLCKCVKDGGKCEPQPCRKGEIWDAKKCKCVPDGIIKK